MAQSYEEWIKLSAEAQHMGFDHFTSKQKIHPLQVDL